MKKTLLILSLAAGFSGAYGQTQVGNSNFEQWDNVGGSSAEPTNWNSFKTASGGLSGFAAQQLNRSSLVRSGASGQYCSKLWSRSVLGVNAQGNMTLGQVNMGNSSATSSSNYNWTNRSDANFSEAFTDTPDTIALWVKYKPNNTSNFGRVSVTIHNNTDFKDPNDVNSANTVAKAIYDIPYNSGNWKRVSIPFSYVGNISNSAYIIATISTCNTPGGCSNKDTLYIDDFELIYVPKASFTASNTVCLGSALSFTNTSTNHPTSYSWDFGDGTAAVTSTNPSHTYASAGTYNVTLTATNQWGSTTTSAYTVTVNPIEDASFAYSSNTYCIGSSNQTPSVNTTGGTFSATPSGLSFVSNSTGEIDLANSSVGTYTVTYSFTGACPSSENAVITITNSFSAIFSYTATTYCTSDSDPSPVFSNGGSAGVFSSSNGLSINSAGLIDLSASTAGNYTVLNTIPASGSCPQSISSFDITVDGGPAVTLGTFTNVCTTTPAFTLSGGSPAGGTYSGSGVTSGDFDPSSATANTSVDISYSYTDGSTGCSNTATSPIFVSDCLGLEDYETAVISVYPNPTNGLVHVANLTGKTSVEVINAVGTVVLKNNLTTSDNTLDLATLNAGVYFVKVNTQLFRVIKK